MRNFLLTCYLAFSVPVFTTFYFVLTRPLTPCILSVYIFAGAWLPMFLIVRHCAKRLQQEGGDGR